MSRCPCFGNVENQTYTCLVQDKCPQSSHTTLSFGCSKVHGFVLIIQSRETEVVESTEEALRKKFDDGHNQSLEIHEILWMDSQSVRIELGWSLRWDTDRVLRLLTLPQADAV